MSLTRLNSGHYFAMMRVDTNDVVVCSYLTWNMLSRGATTTVFYGRAPRTYGDDEPIGMTWNFLAFDLGGGLRTNEFILGYLAADRKYYMAHDLDVDGTYDIRKVFSEPPSSATGKPATQIRVGHQWLEAEKTNQMFVVRGSGDLQYFVFKEGEFRRVDDRNNDGGREEERR